MYVHYMYVVPLEAKIEHHPLELELRMFVSHQMGAGYRTWILCKSKNLVSCAKATTHVVKSEDTYESHSLLPP